MKARTWFKKRRKPIAIVFFGLYGMLLTLAAVDSLLQQPKRLVLAITRGDLNDVKRLTRREGSASEPCEYDYSDELSGVKGFAERWKRRIQGRATSYPKTYPIILALQLHQNEIVLELVNRKANVNARDSYRLTALTMAAIDADESIVRRLVEAGADVNLTGALHRKPLSLAVLNERPKVVKLLLDHGADPDAIDDEDHRSARSIARDMGNKELIALIDKHSPEAQTNIARPTSLREADASPSATLPSVRQ